MSLTVLLFLLILILTSFLTDSYIFFFKHFIKKNTLQVGEHFILYSFFFFSPNENDFYFILQFFFFFWPIKVKIVVARPMIQLSMNEVTVTVTLLLLLLLSLFEIWLLTTNNAFGSFFKRLNTCNILICLLLDIQLKTV